ncbi:MAG: ribosome small subunit-dependent GTPase A [Oscillospiraceae bacterium]|nr:ribosome small subunit-dependent GTPase A [Oscillospiraceae bacterium]MBR2889991.1 ribosome small subunit-dependent GTPase A [Oscillospiraceae bacterium]
MNINDYGYLPDTNNLPGIPARVTAVHKERYEIVCQHGMTHARLKTKEYYAGTQAFPTTGDFVMVNYIPNGDSQIIATLPRSTLFSRREPGPIPRDQAVAANFDYVFIMQSLNQNFNLKRLERYLTLAWQSGATPVILLTKADLVEDYWDYLTQVERVAAGVNTHVVSAHTGYGLNRLNAYLQPGKTVVFLGSSGVGKSSLVNALAGEEIMTVSAIREGDSRGRHTTTHRQLLRLKSGVMIIDTPGMRELGMWDVAEGLGDAFADVESYLGKCRFSDCRHESEPGCAIKAAIASGALDMARWESYQQLKEEAVDRDELMRRKREWSKGVAKFTKQRKKEIW